MEKTTPFEDNAEFMNFCRLAWNVAQSTNSVTVSRNILDRERGVNRVRYVSIFIEDAQRS